MTLLQNAKQYDSKPTKKRKPLDRDIAELVVGCIKGEISYRAVGTALGKKNPGSATHMVGMYLREAYEAGLIEIKLL